MHCSGCGQLLTAASKFCNGCGRPIAVVAVEAKKKKSHSGFALLLALVVILVFVSFIVNSENGTSSNPPVPAHPGMTDAEYARSPAAQAALKQQTAAAQAKVESDRRFTRASQGAVMLKRAMRNPDSFKLTSALVIDATGTACYGYRAQNGFGGLDVGRAVLTPTGKFKSDEMDGFAPLWNKECAHKPGHEEVQTVNYVVDRMSQ